MRQFNVLLLAGLLGAAPLLGVQSVSAAPLWVDPALGQLQSGSNVETVQYRSHGWRHHDGGRRYGDHHRNYGSRHHRNGAAALGGLAAGAIIGGVIANSQARANSESYCAQRFRSYDPSSGTYLGNDGRRHSCP
ncbi:BA14K family protein [Bradyrhizobium sp. 192]|uniref:BA14K family protein n=1 Tax=Bradyrhizobium sp. 192 TaxID=2782660 RepID=UPI001FFE4AC9|nr:BA14K family protein [Bradyrhizobium sp. 192]UPJ55118.1 BA14K family protein [Bradyrhizobium sp. 192]